MDQIENQLRFVNENLNNMSQDLGRVANALEKIIQLIEIERKEQAMGASDTQQYGPTPSTAGNKARSGKSPI